MPFWYHPTIGPFGPPEFVMSNPPDRGSDFKKANELANLSKDSDPPIPALNRSPVGWTWHHCEDGRIMLVPKWIHDLFKHWGGISTI